MNRQGRFRHSIVVTYAAIAFLMTCLALSFGHAPGYAAGAPGWTLEQVAHISNLCSGDSLLYGYMGGLDYDAQGRPVAGFSIGNGCNGFHEVWWARKAAGAWTMNLVTYPCKNPEAGVCPRHSTGSPEGVPPGLALDENGTPFMTYTAYGPWFYGTWYSSSYAPNMDQYPNGAPHLINMYQTVCQAASDKGVYAAQFRPGAASPDYVLGTGGGSVPGSLSLYKSGTGVIPLLGDGPLGTWGLGNGGNYTVVSYALGPQGQDHIAYSENYFRMGAYYSSGPGHETLIARPGQGGSGVSIAVDGSNRIHMVVAGVPNALSWYYGGLLYATSTDGTTWTKQWVDVNNARGPSIALDSQGNPHVSYWIYNNQIRYASLVGGQWRTTRVYVPSAGTSAQSTRLAFDSQDTPHILFFDSNDNNVYLTWPDSSENQAPSATNPGDQLSGVGGQVSLEISATDPEGSPLTYVAVNLPAGLSINGATGLVSGTIGSGALASSPYRVVIEVLDNSGGWTNVEFNWTITLFTDLAVTKTGSPDPVILGNNITYTMVVRNNGPNAASNVILTDLVSPLTRVSGGTTKGTCDSVGGDMAEWECNIGTLASGESATVTLVVKPKVAGPFENEVMVAAAEADSDSSNNVATETTEVTEVVADVAITKSESSDPARVGSDLTYTIVVTNNGPYSATNVSVRDDIMPSGPTLVSASPTKGTCDFVFGMYMECAIGTLAPGESATVLLVIRPLLTMPVNNLAQVTASEPDPDTSNNSDSETTEIVAALADVAITKVDSSNPARMGIDLTYTITVTNNGPDAATNVAVRDYLPVATWISGSTTHGSCTPLSPGLYEEWDCTIGTLASGESATVTLVVRRGGPGIILNEVEVSASEPDPNTSNNSDIETTEVVAALADVAITKADSSDPVAAGADLTYTIVVTNNGPDTANNVAVRDYLPVATWISGSTTHGSCTSLSPGLYEEWDCAIGTLASGESATVTLVVKRGGPGSILNEVEVSASESDPDTSNNSDTETTQVVAAPTPTPTATPTTPTPTNTPTRTPTPTTVGTPTPTPTPVSTFTVGTSPRS